MRRSEITCAPQGLDGNEHNSTQSHANVVPRFYKRNHIFMGRTLALVVEHYHIHEPLAALLTPQYGRHNTETRKSFLDTLHTRVLVWATVRRVGDLRT